MARITKDANGVDGSRDGSSGYVEHTIHVEQDRGHSVESMAMAVCDS